MEITITACVVQIKYNYNIKHTTVTNMHHAINLKVNCFFINSRTHTSHKCTLVRPRTHTYKPKRRTVTFIARKHKVPGGGGDEAVRGVGGGGISAVTGYVSVWQLE